MTAATIMPSAQAESAERWRDGKRKLWLASPLLPMFAFVVWGVEGLGGKLMWIVAGPVILYVLIPVLDTIVGKDKTNPPESAVEGLEKDGYYKWMTFAWIPIQYAVLGWACWMILERQLAWYYVVGAGLSLGIISGISINTGHELGHKTGGAERWLAKIALAQTFYGHFYIEHNRGHHVRVATPEDPASARFGESLWQFIPRSTVGSFKSAWRLEKKRMHRKGYRTWSLRNDFINSWLISIAIYAAAISFCGIAVVPLLVTQMIYGFCLLETINYVEHYGLLRKKTANGSRYLPATPRDSWNSNNIASNVLLFHLQRHSDHHAYPTRRYQSLRHFDESPQLPSGYATMLTIAYIPWLWRKVMDPKVIAHYGGDLTQANIRPQSRDRILARYGAFVPVAVPEARTAPAQELASVAATPAVLAGQTYTVPAASAPAGWSGTTTTEWTPGSAGWPTEAANPVDVRWSSN
jgi:alkane 1-monooxygenase